VKRKELALKSRRVNWLQWYTCNPKKIVSVRPTPGKSSKTLSQKQNGHGSGGRVLCEVLGLTPEKRRMERKERRGNEGRKEGKRKGERKEGRKEGEISLLSALCAFI
jgi:hypothetical protein